MPSKPITPDEAKELIQDGTKVHFVDLREPDAWNSSEMVLPAAIRVAPDQVEHGLASIPHGDPVIVYGSKGQDDAVTAIANRLVDHGWDDVRVLQGGFEDWKDSGHPIEEKAEG